MTLFLEATRAGEDVKAIIDPSSGRHIHLAAGVERPTMQVSGAFTGRRRCVVFVEKQITAVSLASITPRGLPALPSGMGPDGHGDFVNPAGSTANEFGRKNGYNSNRPYTNNNFGRRNSNNSQQNHFSNRNYHNHNRFSQKKVRFDVGDGHYRPSLTMFEVNNNDKKEEANNSKPLSRQVVTTLASVEVAEDRLLSPKIDLQKENDDPQKRKVELKHEHGESQSLTCREEWSETDTMDLGFEGQTEQRPDLKEQPTSHTSTRRIKSSKPCNNGPLCRLEKRGLCVFDHSSNKASYWCRYGNQCRRLATGTCTFVH